MTSPKASTSLPLDVEYDFIIIGGGTAGLTVAARLVEDVSNFKVLVIEAGENHLGDPRIDIPAMWTQALGTDLDWGFASTNQKHLKGRIVDIPQGRAMGGSSAINAQTYVPASGSVVDAWEALGNEGWSWKTLAPYFRKSHTLTLPDEAICKHLGLDWISEDIKGAMGPIQLSFSGSTDDPLTKSWVDTFETLGHRVHQDPYSGGGTGGYSNPTMVSPDTKMRSYAASAYYAPNMTRPNLHVATKASVEKIIFEKTDSESGTVRASSIDVSLLGTQERVTFKARKDIIISAGTIQSPKLLELSGIGGATLLKKLGLPVIIDNPNVGENLQDHIMTGFGLEVNPGVPTISALQRQEPGAIGSAMQLYSERAGPMTIGGIQSHAYMQHIENSDASNAMNDLFDRHSTGTEHETLVFSIVSRPDEGSAGLFLINCQCHLKHCDMVPGYQPGPLAEDYLTLGAIQTHPLSRGSVHITSSDPSKPPSIDPNYFSHPLDIEFFARHLQLLEKIAETEPLASLLKEGGKRNHPLAYFQDIGAAKDYVLSTGTTAFHLVGTCAMMPQEKGGVVNERLVVHGTSNLRVIDASVMPLIPRGNIASSVYAVAERAADLIKEDWARI